MSTQTYRPYPDADELADHWWWRPGWQVGTRFYAWHITVEDQPALRQLVQAYQHQLAQVPSLDLIPERWLHITVQGVGHVADISDQDRDRVVDAVRTRLAVLSPATMTFHDAVIHREAVVVPPTDPVPLQGIRTAIRQGITDVLGQPPDSEGNYRPHVSAAYVNADSQAAPVRERLDQAVTEPTTVRLEAASLIVMHRDRRMYEWTTAATVPIGVTAHPSHSLRRR